MDTIKSAEEQILESLREKEKDYPSIGDFTRVLGVSPSLWTLTRDGKRSLSVTMATAAPKVSPDLEPLVFIFLRFELPNRKRNLQEVKKAG